MDVVLVRWPGEAFRREQLRAAGTARLLLVEDGSEPPQVEDCVEDWIRVPADERDLQARIRGISCRSQLHTSVTPSLDDTVVRIGDQWIALPPVEARLAEVLIERFGRLVPRDALVRAGWPGGLSGRNALDVHVLRLRRRLAVVGLAIRTIRSRGYVLEFEQSASGQQAVPEG